VEQVELVKGGGSSLYGSYAMGGVVNVLTRVPDHDTATLEAGYGSFNTSRLNLYGATVFDGGAVSLNLSQLDTDGYHVVPVRFSTVHRGPVDKRAFSDSQSANLKLDDRLAPDLRLSASFSGFLNEINTGTELAQAAREGVDASTTLALDLHEMGEVRLTLFTGWQEFRNQNSRIGSLGSLQRAFETVALRQYQPTFDLGGSVQWSRKVSDVLDLVTVGLDGRHIWGENREKIYDTVPGAPFGPGVGGFLRRRDTEATQFAGGVFAEVIVKPVPAWLVSASARADFWTTYDAERREGRAVPAGANAGPAGLAVPRREFEDTSHTAISPKVATRYQFNQHVAGRAAGYHAIRFPTINELYRGFFAGNIAFDANASLGPEEVTGAEVGVDLTFLDKRATVKVTPFYNWVHDNIVFVTKSPTLRMRENAGDAVAQGVDMESTLRVTRDLALSANYIFTDSRYVFFRSDRSLKDNRVPRAPEHQVTAGVAYTNPALADVTVRGRYISSSFDDDRNRDELDAHVVLDVSVSREIYKHVQLFVLGENLTDERYLASRSGDVVTLATPLSVFGGVRVKF
jgi:outer membrane receptor protein involved in Fe transport